MKVDKMDNLCNAIYTGLYIVTNASLDEKIGKIFVGLAERTPKDFDPQLTEGFKFYQRGPIVQIKNKKKIKDESKLGE
jgi:hypothetical protein